MSNKKEINNFIKGKIKQDVSRSQIENELSSKYKSEEYKKLLEDYPEHQITEKNKKTNKILRGLIIAVIILESLTIIVGFFLGSNFLFILFKIIKVFLYVMLLRQLVFYLAIGYFYTLLLSFFYIFRSFKVVEKVFDSNSGLDVGLFVIEFLVYVLIVYLSYSLLKKIHPNNKFFPKKNK